MNEWNGLRVFLSLLTVDFFIGDEGSGYLFFLFLDHQEMTTQASYFKDFELQDDRD